MPEAGICQLIPETELKHQKYFHCYSPKTRTLFSVSRSALLYRFAEHRANIPKATRSSLAEIKVKHSARCFGYDTALYEAANEGLVIGDFGEKARNLFDNEKISESHYMELLSKISINGTC